MSSIKVGANKNEQARIKELVGEGHKAAEIASAMGIELSVVESFVDFYSKESEKPKSSKKAQEPEGGI